MCIRDRNILDAANGVISNNTERKEKTLWTENPEGEKIHFRQFMNGYEEAEYVVGDIAKRHRDGTADYHDCAVPVSYTHLPPFYYINAYICSYYTLD